MTRPWKVFGVGFLVLLMLNAIGIYLWQRGWHSEPATAPKSHVAHTKELYHCPMHPKVVSDKPGICPICKMELARVDDEPQTPATSERRILFYRHPMQPQVTSKVPAKDEMGMDYIPVYQEDTPSEDSSVTGRAAFSLPASSQQKIGVTTAIVTERSLSREICATGRVAYDPDLYAAIEEYRQALLTKQQLKGSSYQGFIDQSSALVKSAATRLKLMGLTDEQIGKVGRGGTDSMNLILPEGRVWVYAEVFEYEVSSLKPGQAIEADAPSLPGEVFKGRISSISPVLNAEARSVRVRAEVPDPKGLLRPDTYLNVRIQSDLGKKIAVPEDSVLYTGSDPYVFVKDGDRFHPRAIQLGAKAKGFFQVTSGLSPGEVVVTGANFLVDSESRLKSVLQQNSSEPPHENGGHP